MDEPEITNIKCDECDEELEIVRKYPSTEDVSFCPLCGCEIEHEEDSLDPEDEIYDDIDEDSRD